MWSVKLWRPQQVCNKSSTRLRVRRSQPSPPPPPAPPPPRPMAPSEVSGAANRTSLSNNFPLVSTTHRRKAPGTWHGGSKKTEQSNLQSSCWDEAKAKTLPRHIEFHFFHLISLFVVSFGVDKTDSHWWDWELKPRVMIFFQCLRFEYIF